MKFNSDTVDIIRNFNQITESGMRFAKGNILSVRDGISHVTGSNNNITTVGIAELKQEFTEDFLVFDPIQFFSALSMFENPQIELEDGKIIVGDEKSKKLGSFSITEASPEVVGKTVSPSNFPDDDTNVELHLDAADINQLFKAVGIVTAPFIMFIGKGGDLFIRGHDKDNVTADQYNMPIGITEKEFEIPVKVESINKLMKNVDYNVTLTEHGIVRFVGDYNGNKLSYYFTASV